MDVGSLFVWYSWNNCGLGYPQDCEKKMRFADFLIVFGFLSGLIALIFVLTGIFLESEKFILAGWVFTVSFFISLTIGGCAKVLALN